MIDFLLQKGVKSGTLTKNQFSALHLATYKVYIQLILASFCA